MGPASEILHARPRPIGIGRVIRPGLSELPKAAVRGCSTKWVLLILQNSQENNHARVSF